MTDFNLIWPVSDVPSDDISIYDGPDMFLADFAAATETQRVVFAAYWLQAEVLNGGLQQFFYNDSGVLAPEAVQAFHALGLPKLAAGVESAMQWFGSSYPREREARQAALVVNEDEIYPFDTLDDEVMKCIYEENGGLESTALSYVQSRSN